MTHRRLHTQDIDVIVNSVTRCIDCIQLLILGKRLRLIINRDQLRKHCTVITVRMTLLF